GDGDPSVSRRPNQQNHSAWMNRVKKILIVSAWAPPMAGGSPVALLRRIAALDRGSFSILTSEKRLLRSGQTTGWLPARYHFLDDPRPSDPPHSGAVSKSAGVRSPARARGLPILLSAVRLVRDAIHLSRRRNAVRQRAIEIIRTERPDLVLTTSDDGVFLIGAYEA